MKDILVIASNSTSAMGARGIQAERLIKALSEIYRIFLITSKTSKAREYLDKENISISAISSLHYLFKAAFRRIWFYLSQTDILYYQHAKIKGAEILAENKTGTVLTLSTWYSNAMAGIYLKKRFNNITLISFLSDPLSINPLFYSFFWQKALLRKYEKAIFRYSDISVFPSVLMKDIYSEIYPQYCSKFRVIPHSYNNNEGGIGKKSNLRAGGKKIIHHFGLLYRKRNPFALLDYIKNNRNYFIDRNIEFHFYGPVEKSMNNRIKNYEDSVIRFFGPVPYSRVKEKMADSFALLVIDANFEKSPFLPSKLVEYLACRIPIIALTPAISESRRVLEETGHYWIDYKDISVIKDCIESIEKFSGTTIKNIEDYDIASIAGRWQEIIQ